MCLTGLHCCCCTPIDVTDAIATAVSSGTCCGEDAVVRVCPRPRSHLRDAPQLTGAAGGRGQPDQGFAAHDAASAKRSGRPRSVFRPRSGLGGALGREVVPFSDGGMSERLEALEPQRDPAGPGGIRALELDPIPTLIILRVTRPRELQRQVKPSAPLLSTDYFPYHDGREEQKHRIKTTRKKTNKSKRIVVSDGSLIL
ncbi:hypothetical protein NDU88_002715 [Pleurodeles waltl]|uniref:Uncharacterized protein n=1 Tax=Pleurodeles waltl TaxID=8319 RepID=A0AAV7Q7H8_PLEWA|nr:hypothetical protein NDU88_002715 [Pleurodeles waltl]